MTKEVGGSQYLVSAKSLGSHKINYFMTFNCSQGPSNKAFNLTLPAKMIPNHFSLSFFTLKLPFHKKLLNTYCILGGFPGSSVVKDLPAMQEAWV